MLQFLATNVLMVSLGAMIYLVVRALPRVEEAAEEGRGILDRMVRSDWPSKMDAALNAFSVKFLRKLKVVLLRLDNAIGERLQKNKGGGNQRPQIDFGEVMKQNNGGSPADGSASADGPSTQEKK